MRDGTPKPPDTNTTPASRLVRIGNNTFYLRKHHTFHTLIQSIICIPLCMIYCVDFTHMWLSWIVSGQTVEFLLLACVPFWAWSLTKYLPLIFLLEPIDN